MKNYILNLWNKLPDAWKVKVISIANTFGSTFITTLAVSILAVGTIEWSAAFWSGLLIVAVREAFKAVLSLFVPVRLGGRKR